MRRLLRSLLMVIGLGAGAFALRRQLVHLLTKLTGTWVGTPDA